MCAPDIPAAPDPARTAQVQGAANRDTAMAQQTMNFVDQYTPDWTLKYEKIEDVPFRDSVAGASSLPGNSGANGGVAWGPAGEAASGDGATFSVPRYKAVQTLSPEAQNRQNLMNEVQTKLMGAASDQTDRLRAALATPFSIADANLPSLDNSAVEGRLIDLASRRLNPQIARDEEALRTRLANQGIRLGSAAYDDALRGFNESKNDAYNQLLLTGRQQAFNEAQSARQQLVQELLTDRNQPINEISTLLHGGQVATPNFINPPQTGIAAPDYQGAVRDSYNAQMNAYNQQVASQNGLFGGLFGSLGKIGAAAIQFSDRRLKKDIKRVGETDEGLPIFTYRYKGDDDLRMGVMAQDVEKKRPDAVHEYLGMKMVDYSKVA